MSEVKKRKVHGSDYKAKVGLRNGAWGNGVLLSDGYAVYASYTRRVGLTHAQCWAHVRGKCMKQGTSHQKHVISCLAAFKNPHRAH